MSITITADDFKDFFDRGDFTYSEILPDARDKDIELAISNALDLLNQDLYPTEAIGEKALYYLTAHELKQILEKSESQGQSNFIQSSRGVGSISESLVIPEWMQQDIFAYFATTSYGIQFLIISKPYLDGVVLIAGGATLP